MLATEISSCIRANGETNVEIRATLFTRDDFFMVIFIFNLTLPPLGSVSVSPAPSQQSSPSSHHKTNGPHQWLWGTSLQQKAQELKINNADGTSILRPDSAGSNPAVITSTPITRYISYF
jgi:hypothetical protein